MQALTSSVVGLFLDLLFLLSPDGVGRLGRNSWRQCNTRPTRGEGGASPWHFAGVPKISLISKSPWSGTYQILS